MLVRKDLSYAQQIVQSCHAAIEADKDYELPKDYEEFRHWVTNKTIFCLGENTGIKPICGMFIETRVDNSSRSGSRGTACIQ